MGDKSLIEWTNATWNPLTGCTKVSPGCKNCYAERDFPRHYAREQITVNGVARPRRFTDVRAHPERLLQPLTWQRPRRIFVNSLSDLFHESIPDTYIDRVFAVIARARHHTYQILTKRSERMRQYLLDENRYLRVLEASHALERCAMECLPWPLPHVWLGVSVEDQEHLETRCLDLITTPAAVRFLSCEPLLGPLNFDAPGKLAPNPLLKYICPTCGEMGKHPTCILCKDVGCMEVDGIDWIIAGGESGPGARPVHPDWIRSLRDQCVAAGVPFFFKQWGNWIPRGSLEQAKRKPEPGDLFFPALDHTFRRVNKRVAGHLLDGQVWQQYPEART